MADAVRTLGSSTTVVHDPKALCISSQQFLALGLENQLAHVLEAFPSDVRHDRVFDAMSTRRALSEERFDIVHLAAFVCPRSGAVYFSDVDLRTGRPHPNVNRDVIEADDLVSLLRGARSRLAVITSCDALALATSLIATCHVVAARDMVSANMMAAWVEAFYTLLPKAPLSEALDFAMRASGAPMRLYAQQPNSVDLRMETTAAIVGEVAARVLADMRRSRPVSHPLPTAVRLPLPRSLPAQIEHVRRPDLANAMSGNLSPLMSPSAKPYAAPFSSPNATG